MAGMVLETNIIQILQVGRAVTTTTTTAAAAARLIDITLLNIS